jgi:hypothetical protein
VVHGKYVGCVPIKAMSYKIPARIGHVGQCQVADLLYTIQVSKMTGKSGSFKTAPVQMMHPHNRMCCLTAGLYEKKDKDESRYDQPQHSDFRNDWVYTGWKDEDERR